MKRFFRIAALSARCPMAAVVAPPAAASVVR